MFVELTLGHLGEHLIHRVKWSHLIVHVVINQFPAIVPELAMEELVSDGKLEQNIGEIDPLQQDEGIGVSIVTTTELLEVPVQTTIKRQ